ncbi:MAG: hypothetical protein MJ183_01450 [Treponemataceae bacterium]|nr:hypothetical protein [Treponemataceae bacterium]
MVKNILEWRESLSTMSDHHFFDMMRMYLGEIKTPYNKQKLIEELSVFLRKEQNKKLIVRLLSEEELEILTAVDLLPEPTLNVLAKLFSETWTYAELYEKLMSLEERLVLFQYQGNGTNRVLYGINPHLAETVAPLLNQERLFPPASQEKQKVDIFSQQKKSPDLNPGLLTAAISFALENPDLFKADGSFKKRIEAALPLVFPDYPENLIRALYRGLINLNVFSQTEGKLSLQLPRLKNFALLAEPVQYAYIAVAACAHFPFAELQKQSQLLFNVLAMIPDSGFTLSILSRVACFLREKTVSADFGIRGESRFAAILRKNTEESFSSLTEDPVLAQLSNAVLPYLESAVTLGLLQTVGTDSSGKTVYRAHPVFAAENISVSAKRSLTSSDRPGICSIDSALTVTVLPGSAFSDLMPYCLCAVPEKLDQVLQMSVTKKAVLRAFGFGETPENLLAGIEHTLCHAMPQNLTFSVEDWFQSFSSGTLFKGYVLSVSPEKQVLVEKSTVLAPYLFKTLAEGIYLLNFSDDATANQVIAESGLDFIGSVKTVSEPAVSLPLPALRLENRISFDAQSKPAELSGQKILSPEEADAFKQEMMSVLENMELNEEQRNELKSRIDRKVIVTPAQLRPDSVRPEKTEASGMDYLGKIHVVEHALASQSLLEVTIDGVLYLVNPISISKENGEAILLAKMADNGEEKHFLIARTQKIKRIRGPIFKEPEY